VTRHLNLWKRQLGSVPDSLNLRWVEALPYESEFAGLEARGCLVYR
jgi:hypothetical protein